MAFLLRNQFKIIFTMLLIVICSVFFVNTSLFDEKLTTEVSKIINVPSSLLDENNAYVSLYGIRAASDRDMVNAGLKLIERYRENVKDLGEMVLHPTDYAEILADEGIDRLWMSQYERCVARTESGCLTKLSRQLKERPLDNVRLSAMLSRYDQIISLSNFAEMKDTSLTTPLPAYDVMLRLGNIKLAQRFADGDRKGFLKELRKNIEFWRNVLEKSDLLITKMIATAALWSDAQYAAEFIAAQSITEAEAREFQVILAPLSSSARDIRESFDAELRCMRNWGLHQSPFNSDYGQGAFNIAIGLLYQPNATINQFYDIFVAPMNCLSGLSATELAAEVSLRRNKSATSRCQTPIPPSLNRSPSSLYNLGGKILLANVFVSPVDYISRVHDLNGMFSLVRLSSNLRLTGDQNIGEQVSNSPIRHPYQDEPIRFSITDKTLSFDCLDKHSNCEINL